MSDTEPSPPRAFTQGVGTLFQFAGVFIFLAFFFTCCLSGMIFRPDNLPKTGWGNYSPAHAIGIVVLVGNIMGLAWSTIGLGLQAQRRRSPGMAIIACAIATIFWPIHIAFFVSNHLLVLAIISIILTLLSVTLLLLSITAWREMRRDPPPIDQDVLGPDFKIPYSHLHQDPPEVRMAKELAERRRKLETQQKELEMLEQKLHRKTQNKDE